MTLQPLLTASYYGFVECNIDALILIEACLQGKINHVARRPYEHERRGLIRSGQIFIYEEHACGIRRWTDGLSWSPSRKLCDFLIYRQLVRAYNPRGRRAVGYNHRPSAHEYANNACNERLYSGACENNTTENWYSRIVLTSEQERALMGSLSDSYDLMEDGLVKKTISIQYAGLTHHLVSYYTVEDAADSLILPRPRNDPTFAGVIPRHGLMQSLDFRRPAEEIYPTDSPAF